MGPYMLSNMGGPWYCVRCPSHCRAWLSGRNRLSQPGLGHPAALKAIPSLACFPLSLAWPGHPQATPRHPSPLLGTLQLLPPLGGVVAGEGPGVVVLGGVRGGWPGVAVLPRQASLPSPSGPICCFLLALGYGALPNTTVWLATPSRCARRAMASVGVGSGGFAKKMHNNNHHHNCWLQIRQWGHQLN